MSINNFYISEQKLLYKHETIFGIRFYLTIGGLENLQEIYLPTEIDKFISFLYIFYVEYIQKIIDKSI